MSSDEERFFDLQLLAKRPSAFAQDIFDPQAGPWEDIKILVVGAGGLGCELLHCLALSGFKDIHVIDMDTIDLSNLNRQFLFRQDDIGKPKSTVAAAFVNKRCPWVTVTPHFGRIENESDEFYLQFQLCVLGLDSIHARQWINEKYAGLAQYDMADGQLSIVYSVPIIDGGTEGFKGSSRVIKFGETACINCTLYLFPPQRGVPMCTLENVPRVPAHCVLYAKEKLWEKFEPFGKNKDGKPLKLDGDDPEHILWVMEKAVERQMEFKLEGTIDFPFTQGVVKNVIPAVGFTNAMVAASCVNEALKLAIGMGKNMNNFAFYDGSKAGVASSVNYMAPDPSCSVCQVQSMTIKKDWLPKDVLKKAFEIIGEAPKKPKEGEPMPAEKEADLTADLGGDNRVALIRRAAALAWKTEDAIKVPVYETVKKDLGEATSFRLEMNGGDLKHRVINFITTLE